MIKNEEELREIMKKGTDSVLLSNWPLKSVEFDILVLTPWHQNTFEKWRKGHSLSDNVK